MSKLICVLTHGQADMYPVLAIMPAVMAEHGLKDVQVYIDTVYHSDPQKYAMQLAGIEEMVRQYADSWEDVPWHLYSGSDQWYGLPHENTKTGPAYDKVIHDFLFYRLDRLKNYIRAKMADDDIVLYGPCVWCYTWINGENVPVNMAPERWKLFVPKIGDDRKGKLLELLGDNHVVIQARQKSIFDNYETYLEAGRHCLGAGKKPVYIGAVGEMPVFDIPEAIDLRGELTFSESMWLMEIASNVIVTGSGIGYHRMFFNKPTITLLPMTWGDPKYSYPANRANPKYKFLNCEHGVISDIRNYIDTFFV